VAEAVIFNPGYSHLLMEHSSAVHHISADSAQFETVFKTHFKNLHNYANTIVKDDDDAEEIVQNVFYKLWERKEKINIEQSLTAYLYRSVYYESLNFLKHAKVKEQHRVTAIKENTGATEADNLILKELREKIDSAVKQLPEQCRTIFQMSRFEGLKYKDIAERLGISVKTVENQMGKALKVLRTKLLEYLPVIMFLFINYKNLIR
jgi:RNA polymerase sigma-70 factor, ECF subfamily